MSNTPKKQQRTMAEAQREAVTVRRTSARHQREQRRQRQITIVAAAAIGIALLSLLIGGVYDQFWLPSRPVAQVATTTLSRGQYVDERRNQIARELYGTLDLIGRFGAQFGAQFAERIPQLNTDADPRTIRAAPVDEPTISDWTDRQVISQGAAQQNIQASDGEVAQALVAALNVSFPLPATTPVSPTAEVAPTAAVTVTGDVTTTAEITPTEAPIQTPLPTPGVDQAPAQVDAALRRLYDVYTSQITNTRPNLTLEDFRVALTEQFYRQVLTEKVQAGLVQESGFTPSTDPSTITPRHILVKVEVQEGTSDAEREAAFARRKGEAEAILTQAQGGADFATLAGEKSEDLTTKDQGGLLSGFDKDGKTQDGTQVDPAFVQAALTLTEKGQIYDQVVQTPFGWHIIQLDERVVPTTEQQLQEARTKAFDEWVAKKRGEIGVNRFPPQTPTATAAPTTPAEEPPLPTAPLGGVPTVISDTTTLETPVAETPVAETPTAAPTSAATTMPTAAVAATSAATVAPTTTP